ncbi:hypothetical protein MTO96_029646 [Rhipicephalus appendiculatus]
MQRLASLESKLGPNPKLQLTKKESEWRQEVSRWTTEISTDLWHKATTKKRSLTHYATHKLAPSNEPHYRGDKASALLFQDRTGSLVTQKRRHELFDTDPSCRLCGATEKTIAHVLQACPRLHDRPRTSPSLAELLGLSGQTDETHFDRVNSNQDSSAALGTAQQRGRNHIDRGNTPHSSSNHTHRHPPAWFRQDNTEQ